MREDDIRALCFDNNVAEVVIEAIGMGEASVYDRSGTVIYDDPYFGEPVALKLLRYNHSFGLHVEIEK